MASKWVQIENNSNQPILVRKYQNLDIFSQQRVFHPQEVGIISQGEDWKATFQVKIYSVGENMKRKLLFKILVNKIYKVVINESNYSCKIIQPNDIDKQICAYHRMEEVWDNCNYYETLRIPQTATKREIRLAYLKLAKEFHPDHNDNPNSTLMFERINEAYNTLYDDEIREKYDAYLRISTGTLSKSYWRQIFCHWNRDKAIQVGISTLLTISGGAILLTSLFLSPTGVGLPLSIVGGAIGGGVFSSGIGGLSVALSHDSVVQRNKNYKRWLKYSFWYGIAGAIAGSTSAGISACLGPAISSTAGAIAATGAVNGAVYGISFQATDGIASNRWIESIKRYRIDSIVLDLALASVTGASIGVVFHTALMASHSVSILANQAKYGAKHFLKAGAFSPEKEAPKNRKLITNGTETDNSILPIANVGVQSDDGQFIPKEVDDLCNNDSIDCLNEAIDLFDHVNSTPCDEIIQIFDQTKASKIRTVVEYLLPNPEDENDVIFVQNIRRGSCVIQIPASASMIQISFYRSTLGIKWKEIRCNNFKQVFSYCSPTTRRFFISGFKRRIRISQVRDEFEQLVRI